MVSWIGWIILIVAVWVIFWILKSKHTRHKIITFIIIILLISFYLTFSKIVKSNNLNVGTFDGMVTAGKFYFSWIGQIFGNTKSLAGNAVKMDWTTNSTGK